VAKAAPDGHTLLVTGINHAVNRTLIPNAGFDYEKDLAPITMMAEGNMLLVANPSFPANNVAELIALAKRKPGSVAFSTSVIGSPNYVGAELLAAMGGVEFNVIVYKGITQALQEVVSGESQLVISSLQAAVPLIKAGRLKALAVTQRKRSRFVSDVPTVAESGLAGFDVNNWICLLATGGTPQAVVDRLNAEVRKIVDSSELRDTLEKQSAEPWTTTPAEAAAVIRAETAKWAGILKNTKTSAR
ncbi:MAG: tripartite tricarboxylate transporter substrate binding protein, partial [Betaproteobacteria bacterium]|nr:tripartite tricarboxylate transporter substrate binding protein [Betaproteobacteria bacterium]